MIPHRKPSPCGHLDFHPLDVRGRSRRPRQTQFPAPTTDAKMPPSATRPLLARNSEPKHSPTACDLQSTVNRNTSPCPRNPHARKDTRQ